MAINYVIPLFTKCCSPKSNAFKQTFKVLPLKLFCIVLKVIVRSLNDLIGLYL